MTESQLVTWTLQTRGGDQRWALFVHAGRDVVQVTEWMSREEALRAIARMAPAAVVPVQTDQPAPA